MLCHNHRLVTVSIIKPRKKTSLKVVKQQFQYSHCLFRRNAWWLAARQTAGFCSLWNYMKRKSKYTNVPGGELTKFLHFCNDSLQKCKGNSCFAPRITWHTTRTSEKWSFMTRSDKYRWKNSLWRLKRGDQDLCQGELQATMLHEVVLRDGNLNWK